MGQTIKHIVITWLAVGIFNNVFAQFDTATIKSVCTYVAYIDSINNLDYAQNRGFLHSVDDGVIRRNGEIIGGFGIYKLTNSKEDTIYRMEYNGGVDMSVNKVYYYRANEIVFARLKLIDKNGEFFRKEEFYENGKKLCTDLKTSKKANNYPKETALSLMADGLKYLEDFRNANGRR